MYIPETLSSNPKWAEWIERLPDIVLRVQSDGIFALKIL